MPHLLADDTRVTEIDGSGLDTRALLEGLADGVVVIDAGATVVWANTAASRIIGQPCEEWVGTSGLALVHPDDISLAALALESVQGKEAGTPIELRVRCSTGWRLVEVVGAPQPGGDIALSIRDLTARRRWEVAGDEVARFRSIVQNAAMITMLVRSDGTVLSASAALSRMLGHDQERLADRPLVEIVHADDRSLVAAALAAAADTPSGGRPAAIEAELVHVSGRRVPFELTIVSLVDDPTVQGLVVTAHDISRLRAAQDALAELAHFDSLTGLANRRAFDAALQREWTLTSRDGIDSFVVVADLDRFKDLNDRHGHAAGDQALRRFAQALRLSVRSTDFIARTGGDEFAIILTRCGGETAAVGFESVLRERVAEVLATLPLPVGFTLGHASLRDSVSPDDALHRADVEMLARKQPGR